MRRRDFLAAAAATVPLARLRLGARLAPALPAGDAAPAPVARPFDLARVRLLPGPFLDAMQVNRRYLMGLDPDRLLHTFRLTAGLPTAAVPLGGWEAPENELRGHYTGHYLSACALMSTSLGDADVKARGDLMVAELARCQHALGNGYLSAFPEEFFDRLRAGRPVWAPFYTLHKIMAGLLDMHTLTGNAQALDVLKGMARWTAGWAQPLGDEAMARVLEREYGGMNELLYNLTAVTGTAWYAELAHRFDHERVFGPLAAGRDELKGLHVNTTIPKIIGAARRYELTGEARYRDVAEYFWREVSTRRAYCTGGTSNGEGWNTEPGVLAAELSSDTQECCTSYNMLKLARHVFGWTADPAAADYYERLLWNGVLGTQHPADGEKLYYVPLASGYWKLFGTPLHDFWCCTGTGSESASKFGDSIWFHDDDGVWVNQFIASEVEWAEKGVRLVQDTRFPDAAGTAITVRGARPARFALRVRVPAWTRGGGAALNGRTLDGFAAPGGYFVVDRVWKDGDRLEVALPMGLHMHAMPDDPTVQAVMYGPLVLVGMLGTEGITDANRRAEPTRPGRVPEFTYQPPPVPALRVRSDDPATWIERVSGGADGAASSTRAPSGRAGEPQPLAFRTTGQAQDVTLAPFHSVLDQRYVVYWKVERAG
ncbi:MAG TPA: beta-L-arabinofuranosidase domain-containing protein [Gemmatimonadales bacterium]|nr:beta-L-arabinofuranosidase domain-containing protein [Gemmatimonadales bacterium]